MRFYDLYIVNDKWECDTNITIIDYRGVHKYKAGDAVIEFYYNMVKAFNDDIVLLNGGKWSDYEKCINLST